MTTGTVDKTETVEKTYIYGIPLQKLPEYSVKKPIGNKEVQRRETIDFELLDSVLDFIKVHPSTWRQESWYKIVDTKSGEVSIRTEEEVVTEVNSCGAAFCFAGHVALREGFPNPPKTNHESWNRIVLDSTGDTYRQEASEFAEAVLGLSWSQADVLFEGDNSLEDLEEIVEGLHLNPRIHGSDLREMIERRDWADNDDSELSVKEYMEKYDLLPVSVQ